MASALNGSRSPYKTGIFTHMNTGKLSTIHLMERYSKIARNSGYSQKYGNV